ncbi:MAG: metallophosphoesterase [Treponema sp.]|jgi:hypothetical protein|nr:metallophosphoesterase [Treponema sp.]
MRLAIGDIHGRAFWKHYLDREAGEYYFLGDYFDSFDVPFEKQYGNFIDICKTARKDPRIKLCLGNHDYHYLSGVTSQRYSGFQDRYFLRINEALEENIDLMAIVRKTGGDFLISHAGVTNYFLKALELDDPEEINLAFKKNRDILNFNGDNIFGDDVTQSPIWIRPRSLRKDAVLGYNQIVGHTPVREIDEIATLDGRNRLIFIDTHDSESVLEF